MPETRDRPDQPAIGVIRRGSVRVVANERLTAMLGAILFLLFAAEGLTILLHVGSTLPAHLFLGMVLVPVVLAKTATTGYRFSRYYLGDPDFVDRGPPVWLLRLIGPFVVLTSIVVLATGIADAVMSPRPDWVNVAHKASFVLWFGCMTIHVLGHIRATPKLARADWQTGRQLPGRGRRVAAVAGVLASGLVLGAWALTWTVTG